MTNDEILLAFYNQSISDQLRELNPILWGQLTDRAHAQYLDAVRTGDIPLVNDEEEFQRQWSSNRERF